MKVIIAGTRTFSDYPLLKKKCDEILRLQKEIEIVSGTCKGADLLGEQYAKEKGYPIKQFPANWDLYKKSAGYKRNEQMAEYADGAIIFWDGVSKGSSHMIDLAKKQDLKLIVINYNFTPE